MGTEYIDVNVPRQRFLGWMVTISGLKALGVGEVLMTFHAGQLSLQADWGQTCMTYEGDFNGTVRIGSQGLSRLVARFKSSMQVPAPLKLRLEPGLGNLSMESGGVRAIIVASPGPSAPASPRAASSLTGSLQVKLKAAAMQAVMKKVFPRAPVKKAVLSVTVKGGRLSLQSGTQEASIAVDSQGQGQFALPAPAFANLLSTYPGETMLELEASGAGLRVNSFRTTVSSWNPSPTLPAGS